MYICGVSPSEEADPRATDFEVDYAQFDDLVWPALAHRVPAMEALKLQRAWAGHYDYNTLDQNAVIGRHPEITNFIFANGFSGHGLQQSPATGRVCSGLVNPVIDVIHLVLQSRVRFAGMASQPSCMRLMHLLYEMYA